ncbi:MAG: RDD family protein [Acidobacteriota bacterium]|nr:RDD family protein [Acidobacteriota bacterium]
MRATPSRICPTTYPIAAAATARAYAFDPDSQAEATAPVSDGSVSAEAGQQSLFAALPSDARVISFSSLMSPAERDAILLRAAERPAPLKTARVDSKRPRSKRGGLPNQHSLEFQSLPESLSQPRTQICDAPVATSAVRVQAALIDTLFMAVGCGIGVAMFLYFGGNLTGDKHLLPFAVAALLTVPLLYKLLWAFAGQDTIGTQLAGLELVDFDGRRPSKGKRFQRVLGSILSLLAAGVGMIWALVDEDKLTWHDHISETFPTFSPKE